MNFIKKLVINWVKEDWNRVREEEMYGNKTMSAGQAIAIDRGRTEGQDRINFELSSAVGGRILNVRRYDDLRDHNETTTYVIPSGEDVGARVAKIINLELIK